MAIFFLFLLFAEVFPKADPALPSKEPATRTPPRYAEGDFGYPVDQPMLLSGTFGELRPGHFHSGIDIKGNIGKPLYAAAGGFISRIQVSGEGYGKALYIEHPNGYTTVYGHMDRFPEAVENYVEGFQYRQQRYALELFPERGRFPVRKGEPIGLMGNSGYSFGPHVHFEIRDTRANRPVNPLLFGLQTGDRTPPQMVRLKVYELDDQGQTQRSGTYELVRAEDQYRLAEGNAVTIAAARAGFAVEVFDQMDDVPNRNGIFALALSADDSLIFGFDMKTFSFEESGYINAHLDYDEQVTRKLFFHRCFRLPGNRLSIYGGRRGDGIVSFSSGGPRRMTIVARDQAGNESRLGFVVQRNPRGPLPARPPFRYLLPYREENVIDEYGVQIRFPEGTFYEDLYMQYHASPENAANLFSAVYTIHDYRTPVHHYFDLAIRPRLVPDYLISKAFVAYCGGNGEVVAFGGAWKGGMLKARVDRLGDYCIMADTVPPLIEPVSFQPDMKTLEVISFRIGDNFRNALPANGLKYRAEVDGRWLLMEYDENDDLLIHRFDGHIGPGKHRLKLAVTDFRNNTRVFEGAFER